MPDKPTVQDIHLTSPSPTEFFFIHGYTGSTTDFNGLPQHLHAKYGVNVRVMLLKGHGTTVQDLDDIRYEDLLGQIESELVKDLARYQHVVIGGISFGALMALLLAARYPVASAVSICLPYTFRFPLNVPGFSLLRHYKKYWRKNIQPHEKSLRGDSFHYSHMHSNGFSIVRRARRELARNVDKITCPVLSIHSRHDPIGSFRGIQTLDQALKTRHTVSVFDNKNHNIFYSDKNAEVYRTIEEFFEVSLHMNQADSVPETTFTSDLLVSNP